MAPTPYAELHCHTNFSFLDGASRARRPGRAGRRAGADRAGRHRPRTACTARSGSSARPRPSGSIRSSGSRSSCSTRPSPDPDGIVVPPRRRAGDAARRRPADGRRRSRADRPSTEGLPAPAPARARRGCPAIATRSRRTCAGSASAARGPHLVLLARVAGRLAEPVPARLAGEPGRDQGACRGSARRCSPSTPRASSRCPAAATGSSRAGCGWAIGRARGPSPSATRRCSGAATGRPTQRLLHRAVAPPPARRRLARRGVGGAGRRARPAGRRHQRRPLRPPEDRELADVLTAIRHGRTLDTLGDLRRPDGESYLKSGGGAGGAAAGAPADGAAAAAPGRRGSRPSVELAASCSVDLGFEQYRFPGFPVPDGETPFSYLVGAVLGGRPEALPPADLGGRQAARPRARRHRAGRPRRVLPHLLGPDALREGAGDPGPGPGQRDQLDRVVHARDQPGRADRPQPAVRAVHQRGPDDLPGRRHRLQLGAARGGHPVRLRALRARAHRDGLQPRHVPGALGGARGGLRARVPAAARRPGGEGARDVRLRHGPARPRGRRRVRRVLPAAGRGAAGRGARGRGRRGARPRRRDGPAEHADPARRQGAALAPATEAGGPERAAAVRLAPGGDDRRRTSGRRTRVRDVGGGARVATGDPAGRPDRRRGRPGRHAGERRLAAGGSRHGLRGGSRTGWSRRRSSTAGGSIRRAASSSRRRGGRRAARPIGSAGPAAGIRRHRAGRPGRCRGPLVGRPGRARAAAPGPRRLDGRPLATGSAGSSSAPGSTASRATSRSTRAACS